MADVTISNLSPLTPSTGLYLPVTNGSSTGKVTLAEVCGVITSTQITNALGYTPYDSSNPAGYITSSSLPSSQQLAKAWVNFNGTGGIGNQTIRAQYNVSSVYKNGTGDYTINFTSAMPDANYVVSLACDTISSTSGNANVININSNNPPSSTSFRITSKYPGTAPEDRAYIFVTVFR